MSKFFYSLFVFFVLAGTAHAQGSMITAAQKADQSIVDVKTVYVKALRTSEGSARVRGRLMSYERNAAGVIVDARGIIVTNTHTIVNAPHIFVVLRDGTKLDAKVVFVSPLYDFSLLKVASPAPLTPIEWAESSQVELGQSIIGIGNSDYDDRSIMAGEVTRLLQSRANGSIEFLEVNLSMYKGDSGGPILDRDGRLLGIVMAREKGGNEGILAIASDKIREQFLRQRL